MNATETVSLHQQLINEACEFKNTHNLAYATFIEALDKRHKAAILFKDLNYQVLNGGFLQWLDNKMGTDNNVDLLLEYLREINTNAAIAVSYMLMRFQNYSAYDDLNYDYTRFSKQLLIDVNEWLGTIPEV